MPTIIDYPDVLSRLQALQLQSLYHNSGAFGFPAGVAVQIVGWLGENDPTIRPEARIQTIQVAVPYDQTLARLLVEIWQRHLGGAAWVMPMSHWNYELDFGSREWLPDALREVGVDADLLAPRNNAAAIEFQNDESEQLEIFVRTLLSHLVASDFAVIFPNRPAICTIHHHRQLWWQTTDLALANELRSAANHNRTP